MCHPPPTVYWYECDHLIYHESKCPLVNVLHKPDRRYTVTAPVSQACTVCLTSSSDPHLQALGDHLLRGKTLAAYFRLGLDDQKLLGMIAAYYARGEHLKSFQPDPEFGATDAIAFAERRVAAAAEQEVAAEREREAAERKVTFAAQARAQAQAQAQAEAHSQAEAQAQAQPPSQAAQSDLKTKNKANTRANGSGALHTMSTTRIKRVPAPTKTMKSNPPNRVEKPAPTTRAKITLRPADIKQISKRFQGGVPYPPGLIPGAAQERLAQFHMGLLDSVPSSNPIFQPTARSSTTHGQKSTSILAAAHIPLATPHTTAPRQISPTAPQDTSRMSSAATQATPQMSPAALKKVQYSASPTSSRPLPDVPQVPSQPPTPAQATPRILSSAPQGMASATSQSPYTEKPVSPATDQGQMQLPPQSAPQNLYTVSPAIPQSLLNSHLRQGTARLHPSFPQISGQGSMPITGPQAPSARQPALPQSTAQDWVPPNAPQATSDMGYTARPVTSQNQMNYAPATQGASRMPSPATQNTVQGPMRSASFDDITQMPPPASPVVVAKSTSFSGTPQMSTAQNPSQTTAGQAMLLPSSIQCISQMPNASPHATVQPDMLNAVRKTAPQIRSATRQSTTQQKMLNVSPQTASQASSPQVTAQATVHSEAQPATPEPICQTESAASTEISEAVLNEWACRLEDPNADFLDVLNDGTNAFGSDSHVDLKITDSSSGDQTQQSTQVSQSPCQSQQFEAQSTQNSQPQSTSEPQPVQPHDALHGPRSQRDQSMQDAPPPKPNTNPQQILEAAHVSQSQNKNNTGSERAQAARVQGVPYNGDNWNEEGVYLPTENFYFEGDKAESPQPSGAWRFSAKKTEELTPEELVEDREMFDRYTHHNEFPGNEIFLDSPLGNNLEPLRGEQPEEGFFNSAFAASIEGLGSSSSSSSLHDQDQPSATIDPTQLGNKPHDHLSPKAQAQLLSSNTSKEKGKGKIRSLPTPTAHTSPFPRNDNSASTTPNRGNNDSRNSKSTAMARDPTRGVQGSRVTRPTTSISLSKKTSRPATATTTTASISTGPNNNS